MKTTTWPPVRVATRTHRGYGGQSYDVLCHAKECGGSGDIGSGRSISAGHQHHDVAIAVARKHYDEHHSPAGFMPATPSPGAP